MWLLNILWYLNQNQCDAGVQCPKNENIKPASWKCGGTVFQRSSKGFMVIKMYVDTQNENIHSHEVFRWQQRWKQWLHSLSKVKTASLKWNKNKTKNNPVNHFFTSNQQVKYLNGQYKIKCPGTGFTVKTRVNPVHLLHLTSCEHLKAHYDIMVQRDVISAFRCNMIPRCCQSWRQFVTSCI